MALWRRSEDIHDATPCSLNAEVCLFHFVISIYGTHIRASLAVTHFCHRRTDYERQWPDSHIIANKSIYKGREN